MAILDNLSDLLQNSWGALKKMSGHATREQIWHGVGGGIAGTGGLFSVLGVGVAGGLSAVFSQLEYNDQRKDLRHTYREEIAAKLGKSPQDVNDKDLSAMAASNHTIAEEITKERRQRNFGIVVNTASMLGALAIVATALSVAGIAASVPVLSGAFVAKVLLGYACHKMIESPLTWVGKKLFGIDQPTIHDRIKELAHEHKHGKDITREQLLGIFASADPAINQFIQSQFGAPYEKLGRSAKQHAVQLLENTLPLGQLADNLNNGRINITELAFAVDGQISGVLPKIPQSPKPGLFDRAGHALRGLGQKLGMGRKETALPQQPSSPLPNHRKIVEFDNDVPTRSFAAQIEAERAQAQAQGQTIH